MLKISITENTENEKKLKIIYEMKNSEKNYTTIFENPIIGIYQTAIDGRIITTNKTMAHMLGYDSVDELINSILNIKMNLFFNDNDLEKFLNILEKDNRVLDFETQFITKQGKQLDVLINSYIIKDNDNKILYEGIIQDNTEKKRIKDLKLAKEAAEASNKAKSDFLANVSHELRTPMNAIMGYTRLLDKLISDSVQRDYLKIIQTNGKNLLSLINDILDLSKVEAGKLDIVYKPVDLNLILNEIKNIFHLKIKEKGIKFLIENQAGFPTVLKLDETRIRQILYNLVENAIKFTDYGSVKLTISKSQPYDNNKLVDISFRVKDTGIGIPERQIEKIFEAFEQQKGQNIKFGGTGIGLTITKRLTELMRGKITVHSKVNKGSTFIVDLYKVETGSIEYESYPSIFTLSENIYFKKSKILLIENNQYYINLMISFLESRNIEVEEALSIKEAVDKLEFFLPDLIIIDYKLIALNNRDIFKSLRENIKFMHIPIIFLLEENEKNTIEADDFISFLVKPVNENALYLELMKFLPYYYVDGDKSLQDNVISIINKNRYPLQLSKKELEEITIMLSQDLMKEWISITEFMILDQWAGFGNKIKKIGENFNIFPLINYGQLIIDNINFLNIVELKKIIKQYPEFSDSFIENYCTGETYEK